MNEIVDAVIHNGLIHGIRTKDVCRFNAIPYAQAPVGALRFEAPQKTAWSGVHDATQPGPVAPQLPSRLRDVMGDFNAEQSEDCLHLTVWTPAIDKKRRPVVIWLHGGAWQSGAGALDWYDGAQLAAQGDIVVVAPNYRLAALGWLSLPGASANLGLLDQEMAIAWVADNIEAFGGDPTQITVMGQSAGGACIASLLSREPRFQRAILQSASLGRGFRSASEALALGEAFLAAAGAKSLEHARALPISALLQAQQAPEVAQVLKAEGSTRSLFCLVADGTVLPHDIGERMAEAAVKVDCLAGYTLNEMAAFPGMQINEDTQALGDQVFGSPALQWAKLAAAAGRKAWSYRFDYAPTPRFGACHCIELPFVFGTLDAFADAPMLHGSDPDHARKLSAELQRSWLSFIRGDTPGWDMAPGMKVFA